MQRLFDSAEAAMNNGDLLGAITRLETLQGYPASAVRSASVATVGDCLAAGRVVGCAREGCALCDLWPAAVVRLDVNGQWLAGSG